MGAHNASVYGIGCQAVRTPYIKFSPPYFSEGGSLCLPIRATSTNLRYI